MKRLFIWIVGVWCCLGSTESAAIADTLRSYLEQTFQLYSAEDYRPAINTKDFYNPQKFAPPYRGSRLYELAASILGYKDVVHIEIPFLQELHLTYPRFAEGVREALQWYATDPAGMGIVYTQAGRYKALLLLEAEIDAYRATYLAVVPRFSFLEREYLRGRCLGYPEEDIKLYVQRRAFVKNPRLPQNVRFEIPRDIFETFVDRYWKPNQAPEYQRAKERIDTYINTNSPQDVIERINEYRNHPYTPLRNIVYDQPIDEVVASPVQFIQDRLTQLYHALHALEKRLRT